MMPFRRKRILKLPKMEKRVLDWILLFQNSNRFRGSQQKNIILVHIDKLRFSCWTCLFSWYYHNLKKFNTIVNVGTVLHLSLWYFYYFLHLSLWYFYYCSLHTTCLCKYLCNQNDQNAPQDQEIPPNVILVSQLTSSQPYLFL